MKTKLSPVIAFVALVLWGTPVHALYSCNVSSGGVGMAYNPLTAGNTIGQSSASVTCTRDPADAGTLELVLVVNNGANPSGQGNRATQGGQTVAYELFQDSVCATQWRTGGNGPFSRTLNFGGGLSASMPLDYWACIPANQTGLAAGTYTDTVIMTLTYGPKKSEQTAPPQTFGVNISTPAQCLISTPPGTMDFGTYVAFGPALSASTTFGVTCTSYVAYTMAVTPALGVLTGLNYTVSSPASGTGTGMQQLLPINGSMAGGQAGQCAGSTCSGSNIHTVTVTY